MLIYTLSLKFCLGELVETEELLSQVLWRYGGSARRISKQGRLLEASIHIQYIARTVVARTARDINALGKRTAIDVDSGVIGV